MLYGSVHDHSCIMSLFDCTIVCVFKSLDCSEQISSTAASRGWCGWRTGVSFSAWILWILTFQIFLCIQQRLSGKSRCQNQEGIVRTLWASICPALPVCIPPSPLLQWQSIPKYFLQHLRNRMKAMLSTPLTSNSLTLLMSLCVIIKLSATAIYPLWHPFCGRICSRQ